MSQLKFNKKGVFIPQKVRFVIQHSEETQEIIDKYVESECNFQIKYTKKGEPKIIKKNKIKKEVKKYE